MISKRTYESIRDKSKVKVKKKGKVPVKGRKMEIAVFKVLGLEGG